MGQSLATGSSDNLARVSDLSNLRPVTFRHFDDVLPVAFSPDGEYLRPVGAAVRPGLRPARCARLRPTSNARSVRPSIKGRTLDSGLLAYCLT
jgi:hypothetical protein